MTGGYLQVSGVISRGMFTPLLVGLAALYSIGCNAVATPIVTQPTPEPRHATETVRAPTKGPTPIPALVEIQTPTSVAPAAESSPPPTPTAVQPTPTPTIVIPTLTSRPTPTKEPIDPFVALINSNPDLNYKLTDRSRQSMIRELKDSPYAAQLLPLIAQLSEAWNYKVRREDEVLCVIIPRYTPGFDCNSEEAWKFREENGKYHLESWDNYRKTGDVRWLHILPLDNDGLREWFPNREDREFVYMNGLWVPDAMLRLDISDMKNDAKRTGNQRDERQWTNLQGNMDVITGVKKINGLTYDNLRDRIVTAVKNPELKSYVNMGQVNGDYWGAREYWKTQTLPILPGFNSTLTIFGKEFAPILERNWKEFPYVIAAFGLGMNDGFVNGLPEQLDTTINQTYQKGNGFAGFLGRARYPSHSGEHQATLFPVSYRNLLLLPNERVVYRGQTIGPYSALRGLREDKIPFVRSPNSVDIAWRLEN